jgi:hypothetical protein
VAAATRYGRPIVLVLIILMLAIAIPSPVQATDAPTDLVLGGQGSVAWTMGAIQPGDNGTKDVEIRNAGPSAAYLKLWISDVVETDYGGDGAALSKYLRLALTADGLQTSLNFPTTIDRLPRYPSGGNQLTVGPLAAGSSVVTHWNWAFLDNGNPQNDAQGDGISFTINYLLAEAPPPGESFNFIIISMLGQETVAAVNSTGVVQQSIEATDPRGMLRLSVPQGATILTPDGLVPSHLTLVETDPSGAAPPEGMAVVGPAYELEGYLDEVTRADVHISPQAGLSLGVSASDLPAGQEIAGVYALDSQSNWSPLPGPAGARTSWEARAFIGSTGTFVVLARPIGSGGDAEAFMTAQGLVVTPAVDQMWWPIVLFSTRGGSVTISVFVTNRGEVQGSEVVTLFIDGKAVDAEVVDLGPGESRKVTFTAAGMTDGGHEVRVAGQTGRFTATSTIEWPTLIALMVGLTLVILFVTRKRPEPKEIPDVLMADYKKRVLRELNRQDLSFSALSNLTSIEEVKLIPVLELLWKEGMIGTKFRDGNLVYEGVFTIPHLKKKG